MNVTQEPSSSFKALDLLNRAAALQNGGSVLAPGPTATTKFEKVVNSLSSFLTSASDTIITVDSLINGPGGSTAGQQTSAKQPANQLPAAASTAIFSPARSNIGKWAIWGGLAAGGALLSYMAVSGNKKRKR